MNNKSIKYAGFYDVSANKSENRMHSVSAVNKMNYIIHTLKEIGYVVDVISPSWTNNNNFYKGKLTKESGNMNLKLFSTLPWRGKIFKLLSILFSSVQFFFYLLKNMKKKEQIVVYHSKWLSIPIILLKTIRNDIVLILEVEEIYDDIQPSKFWRFIEYKVFNLADKFIFSTELLNSKLNHRGKAFAVAHGAYLAEPIREESLETQEIKIVYAGTFDQKKGGVTTAISTARYLPENYHVHIIGFGTEEEVKKVVKLVNEISQFGKSKVSYAGLLQGEEYIKFLQKCHIGLSTQTSVGEYNQTSFPSKVLSYMSNGLRVVSVRIKAIEKSAIGDSIYYYDEQDPSAVAKAIMSIDFNENYNSREIIQKLDDDFKNELNKLLEQL
ncbi:glycosyltransferase [Paenibacillus sp. CN-4]|uniref:glycosyltransferase n=1 Tax=Paenibacillus nanchangensis TaxID=3348343 RepID=UPI00397A6F20